MKTLHTIPLFLLLICLWSCESSTGTPNQETTSTQYSGINPADSLIILQNDLLSVQIEQYGGHFTGIELKTNPINPLTWGVTAEQMPLNNQNGAPFKGHFLCLGRWGSPSDGEKEAGIPHNGEQSNTLWNISVLNNDAVQMSNEAPLDGLTVEREVRLIENQAAFIVKETFSNTHSLGRVSNVVQHATIGPPFLTTQTLYNSNAKKGFNQKFSYPNPHAYEYEWPMAIIDTTDNSTNDLRKNDAVDNFVSTHLFDQSDEYGWVSAYDPNTGIILAYIWKLTEYPWINIWSHFEAGKPFAKGLEFGTTGIGRPYKGLLETDTRFHGVNSWEYMDAGQQEEKTYLVMMMDIGNTQENPSISLSKNEISVNGKKVMDNPL
ncbi:MAG: hypothetical protein AAFO07_06075 [Bacteroidota bacterium]